MSRNYRLFDLRFTEKFAVENLPKISTSRFTITPALTVKHQNDVINNTKNSDYKPSLDEQYNTQHDNSNVNTRLQ
ncbi:hypothetical protein ACJRPK_06015 [Aquimarina sp. 2-A2]|uniref:hypothetical protein n=1 Tax=Aquimarina sp. 2-A2 TaxID=3382644 RepID=UPI00387F0349